MNEFEKFYGKIWETGNAKVITIPVTLIDGIGLKKGDKLKIMIRKEVKENVEDQERKED